MKYIFFLFKLTIIDFNYLNFKINKLSVVKMNKT